MDPRTAAEVVLAALAGFLIGWLLAGRFVGGCLLTVLGVAALVGLGAIVFGTTGGRELGLIDSVAEMVSLHGLAVVALILALVAGARTRSRARART